MLSLPIPMWTSMQTDLVWGLTREKVFRNCKFDWPKHFNHKRTQNTLQKLSRAPRTQYLHGFGMNVCSKRK